MQQNADRTSSSVTRQQRATYVPRHSPFTPRVQVNAVVRVQGAVSTTAVPPGSNAIQLTATFMQHVVRLGHSTIILRQGERHAIARVTPSWQHLGNNNLPHAPTIEQIPGEVKDGLNQISGIVGTAQVVASEMDEHDVVTARSLLPGPCRQTGDVTAWIAVELDVPVSQLQSGRVSTQ